MALPKGWRVVNGQKRGPRPRDRHVRAAVSRRRSQNRSSFSAVGALALVTVALLLLYIGWTSLQPGYSIGPGFRGGFVNCSHMRALGLAPAARGELGYAPHLDRDNDGIACEPWPRR